MDLTELPLACKIPQAEAALNMSRYTIYDGIKRGEIRALRVGKALRIPRAEIARLLGEADPTQPAA